MRPGRELAVRDALSRHFDVVVVIWALALVLAWSVISLSRADLTNDQWSGAQQHGPVWVVPADS